jgi:DinB superfamily
MRLILAQDRPQLTGYDQDLWAERLQYDQEDPSEALELFAVLRHANLRVIERASSADLKRVGVHVERGEESLEHLRRLYAGHDLMHLRQIERVRRAVA